MTAKGLYIEKMFCRFVGKPCRVKVSNFIPKQTQVIIETGIIPEQYGLTVDKRKLFQTLRTVYPEEFGPDVNKYMDRVDEAVRDNEKEQLNHIHSEEWFEGYEAAVEIMQQEMNEITEELKDADKG